MPEREESPIRLIIVEDDDRTREELERILGRQTGFVIESFEKPGAALAAVTSARPDLALLDLKLPEMDGIALLDRMRERAPDVMAIIMTGFGEAETARNAREHGAADFVEKPLDLPYLLVTLRQQAREALLRRNLRASGELRRPGAPRSPVPARSSTHRPTGRRRSGPRAWPAGRRPLAVRPAPGCRSGAGQPPPHGSSRRPFDRDQSSPRPLCGRAARPPHRPWRRARPPWPQRPGGPGRPGSKARRSSPGAGGAIRLGALPDLRPAHRPRRPLPSVRLVRWSSSGLLSSTGWLVSPQCAPARRSVKGRAARPGMTGRPVVTLVSAGSGARRSEASPLRPPRRPRSPRRRGSSRPAG